MQGKKATEKKFLWSVIELVGLSVVSAIISILCIFNSKQPFVQAHLRLFCVFSTLFIFILGCVGLMALFREKTLFFRAILSAHFFLVLTLILLFILQRSGFFQIVQDETALREYLLKAGVWMPLVYILLQFLQVVILPIPSLVSTLAGVALFGPLLTTLYSVIGILLGSYLAFYIGRKYGAKAVTWIIGRETLTKWRNKFKGKDGLLLALMFFLPLFPDDILCFVAGLSNMSARSFLCIITLSRVIGILATTFSVKFIPINTWWGIALWAGIFVVFGLLIYLVNKHTDTINRWWKKRGFHRKKKE